MLILFLNNCLWAGRQVCLMRWSARSSSWMWFALEMPWLRVPSFVNGKPPSPYWKLGPWGFSKHGFWGRFSVKNHGKANLCWKAPMPSTIRDLRFFLRHSRRVAQCFFPWTYPIFNVFSWISWLILWPLRRPCCLVNCLLAASASTWLCMFAPWPGVGWKPYSCAAKQVQQRMWLATVPASARVNLGRGRTWGSGPRKNMGNQGAAKGFLTTYRLECKSCQIADFRRFPPGNMLKSPKEERRIAHLKRTVYRTHLRSVSVKRFGNQLPGRH